MTRTLVSLLILAGCGSTDEVSARRTAADSVALMSDCYRGVIPKVRPLAPTDVYCSRIYRRPSCAKAWLDLSIAVSTPVTPDDKFDGRAYVAAVVAACRAEYCVAAAHETTLAVPALCSPEGTLEKETLIAFVTWLVDQELTFPIEQSEKWARGANMDLWLQSRK